MDRHRVAPARPVRVYSAGPGGHLRPAAAGRWSGGAEIGIFTAERYFSAADLVGRHDAVLIRPEMPDHHPHEPSAMSVASQRGSTAASSKASWNSRSGLLSGGGHRSASVSGLKGCGGAGNVSGDPYGGGNKKAGSSGQRWTLFRRHCLCVGRKAVTLDAASEPMSTADARFIAQSAARECLESAIFKAKTPSPLMRPGISNEERAAKMKVTVTTSGSRRAFSLAANDILGVAAASNRGAAVPSDAFAAAVGRRARGFTFPAALDAARLITCRVSNEPPRASLEVFRPIDEDLVMLAEPPPPAMPAAASRGRDPLAPRAVPPVIVTAPAAADEEAMSDASSDLFDLENFTVSSSYLTTYRGHRGSRRNSADLPCAAALAEPALSECGGLYAPSEASVVWSVATAEGGGAFDAASVANFSSAASPCGVDEFRFVVPESREEFTAAMSRSAAAGQKKGGRGGFLNSCRCEKAVSVGPTPVRMVKPPAYPAVAKRAAVSTVWT